MSRRRVFLSYHSADRDAARQLVDQLGKQDADIEILFDVYNLSAGAFWIPALADGISTSDAIIILLGPKGPGQWQLLEYQEALRRKVDEPYFPIVPVALGDSAPRLPFINQIQWLRLPEPFDEAALVPLISAIHGNLAPGKSESWRSTNPYRGLLAMSESDSDFFFGRHDLCQAVINALRNGQRCIALVGNSGVGKSSLVRAGVVAALRRQRLAPNDDSAWPADLAGSRRWLFLEMRPSDNPLFELSYAFVRQGMAADGPGRGELAEAWAKSLQSKQGLNSLLRVTCEQFDRTLGHAPERVVIVVDQGEELYTRSPPDQSRRFSEILASAVDADEGLIVIGSLRSDHYGHLQDDTRLFPIITRIDVPPLGEDGIRDVIQCPASALGVRFENKSVPGRIAAAVAREPGALPLLSYMLQDAWSAMQRRGDKLLSLTSFSDFEGIQGVLTRRAEDFLSIHRSELKDLRRLFTLRLAHVPLEGEVVRRRARCREMAPSEWALVQELADPNWRLLVTGEEAGEPMAEVAHEVLLRQWERLRQWLDQERLFLQWRGYVEQDRKSWEQAAAPLRNKALLTGLRLDQAVGWLAERRKDLSEEDRSFIEKSVAARVRQRQRGAVLAGIAVAIMAVLTVTAIVFAIRSNERLEEAINQKQKAEQLSEELRSREDEIADFGQRLNAALASKVQELSRYRSEFFGRIRVGIGTRNGIRIVGDRFVLDTEIL